MLLKSNRTLTNSLLFGHMNHDGERKKSNRTQIVTKIKYTKKESTKQMTTKQSHWWT